MKKHRKTKKALSKKDKALIKEKIIQTARQEPAESLESYADKLQALLSKINNA